MISILISTQNPIKEYFKLCLDSIFNQTYQDFEIVLVDDGSDEKIIDFIKKEKYELSKIKYIRLDQNVGLPKALNIGLKQCSGKYIARMDDDDLMISTRLEKQLEYVETNKLDGCFSWFDTIDDEGEILNRSSFEMTKEQMMNQLLSKGNIFCHASLFLKKEVLIEINGYDENLRYAQDSELYIRIMTKFEMGIVNDYLLQHRVNNRRNNSYRETLSLTYALFGAMNYYTSHGNLKFKDKIRILERLLRYFIGLLKIAKK